MLNKKSEFNHKSSSGQRSSTLTQVQGKLQSSSSQKKFFRLISVFITYYLLLTTHFLYADIITGSGDIVLGQNDFSYNGRNFVDAKGLYYPYSIAIDTTTNRVYVADAGNNRVLWWNNISSLVNGKQADGVLGQPDFYSNLPNRGGSVAANTLYYPSGVSVDGSGNVWVADSDNHRVINITIHRQVGQIVQTLF